MAGDRSTPQGGDRPLDIDTLACGERDDFCRGRGGCLPGGSAGGDVSGRRVDSGRLTLGLPGGKGVCEAAHRPGPIHLCQQDEALLPGNGHPGPLPGTPPSGTLEPFTHEAPKGASCHGGPPCPR